MARRRTELRTPRPERADDTPFTPFAEVFTASAAGEDRFPEELIVDHAVAEHLVAQEPTAQEPTPQEPPAEGQSAQDPPAPDSGADPEGILSEPPDTRDISAELAAPPRPRLPWLTLLLSGGVVAGLAFTGGALVEKSHLQGSSGAGSAGRNFAAGPGGQARTGSAQGGGRQGFGAATGGPGAGAGVTTGTVKLVDGTTLYVTDAQGNVVKVTTDTNTQVTQAKSGKVTDLQPGQTVTVRGSQNPAGDLAATTVAQGGAGGFAGQGGGRG
ncbi:DUF5666 domain-containing protein [Streptomyces roseus]|uniref:DUF5666 domain-containing protein n=1 Tax=Streptomyces roseus TaxID=66430 RepID=UPI0033D8A7F1